jgi:TFIIF-interacting CTD phosphatase-like protein
VDENLTLINPPYVNVPTQKKFTLVLDLDETLLHYMEKPSESLQSQEGILNIRPGADDFLKTLASHFEIIIFTAAMQDYADWVLDNLDTNRIINYRLYRQHAVRNGAVFIKDMSKLGAAFPYYAGHPLLNDLFGPSEA